MKSISLDAFADGSSPGARHSSDGWAAYTVHGGHDHALQQTVVALAKGHRLRGNGGLGEATLQVLRGRVRLTTVRDTWEGVTGDQLTIPSQRHSLDALRIRLSYSPSSQTSRPHHRQPPRQLRQRCSHDR